MIVFVGGLVSILAGIWLGLGSASQAQAVQNCPLVESTSSNELPVQEAIELINVDIGGAVEKPGLYELKNGSRYADIISLAGGPTRDVSKEFMAKELNLSKQLNDQEKVYLPFSSEEIVPLVVRNDVSNMVSVNNATSQELQNLKGVGEATAQKIISGRPYSELTELVGNKIISEKLFNDLKTQLKL